MISIMDMECFCIKMEKNMKATGKKEKNMEKEKIGFRMVTFTKV